MRIAFSFLLLSFLFFCACKSTATYPLDEPKNSLLEKRIEGKWHAVEDTNRANYYKIEFRRDEEGGCFHLKFYNRGGTNPTYEGDIAVSEIKGQRFLSIPYWEGRLQNRGYFFLRMLNVSAGRDSITTCMVADTTMRRFTNSKELRKYIARNVNHASFYSDTVHFYRFE